MCGSFRICNVCQIKCIKSIGIWFWHQFEYTKVSLNMQVRLYTSVHYAEISLYILCVYVGVSDNDDRGMKCVWPLLFNACISVLFSLKQWLQVAAVGWGAVEGEVWKDDSFYGRRPHGNGSLCVSEPLTWTVTAGEPSSHPTPSFSLSLSHYFPLLFFLSHCVISASVLLRCPCGPSRKLDIGIGVVFWVYRWIWGGSAFCTELENSSCISQCGLFVKDLGACLLSRTGQNGEKSCSPAHMAVCTAGSRRRRPRPCSTRRTAVLASVWTLRLVELWCQNAPTVSAVFRWHSVAMPAVQSPPWGGLQLPSI